MKVLAVVGAGSHTRSSFNLLKKYFGEYTVRVYDDSYTPERKEYIHNSELVGRVDDIPADSLVFISVGDNKRREHYFKLFRDWVITDNLIHEKAYVEDFIKMGISNQVFAGAYLNSYVVLGDNNIINSSAVLEHEVEIGSHSHVSVGARICGRSKIGNRCLVGSGSIVIDKVSVCDDVIIGAGSIVIKDITESGTYVGNPARKIK